MLLRPPTSNQRPKYDFSSGWFEGGEGVPTNPSSHLVLRRGQKMQIVPIHHQHAKNRRPWILLPVVFGPWTSFVAALDKGRSNIAVCRRYTAPIQNSSGKVWRPLTIWARQNLQLRGDMQQITAHSNPYSSFSLSFCPLCIRRGFYKSFARGRAEQMLKVMNSVSRTSLAIIISLRDVPVLSYNDMFF